jgi:hemerythrin-like domain-containing protein
VKFVSESLIRHLYRLLDLEDETEAADPISECKPHLAERANALQLEHAQFRAILQELSEQAEELSPENEVHFQAFCTDAIKLLDRLDAHEQAELAMLQELHNSDEGGEG